MSKNPPPNQGERPIKRRKSTILSKEEEEDARLPVTVLSGFLGAGKTSVLQHILHSPDHKLKIVVIVNDMAAVNMDAKAVVKIAPKTVSMQNGCICCTLRQDLLQQVTELSLEKKEDGISRKWDYLVIESTGISEPLPVAQTFVMEVEDMIEEVQQHQQQHHGDHEHSPNHHSEEESKEGEQKEEGERLILTENPLLNYARLDTMVTIVDACSFFEHMEEIQRIKDQPDAEGNEDEGRTLADLMMDQVEFANVILVNKCDSMIQNGNEEELQAVEACVKRLNPTAKVVRTNYGKVPHTEIINTKLFDMEKAEKSAGWLNELSKPEHTPETEEYGVSSLVFRSNKPFHPTRLSCILSEFGKKSNDNDNKSKEEESSESPPALLQGVIRSKGQIWLANALSTGFSWHSAGYQFGIEPANPFFASAIERSLEIPFLGKAKSKEQVQEQIEELFGEDEDGLAEIERLQSNKQWDDDFGDRSQELVLIGVHLNKEKMREALEMALLTEEEMEAGMKDLQVWKAMEDPFFGGDIVERFWDIPKDDEDEAQDDDDDN